MGFCVKLEFDESAPHLVEIAAADGTVLASRANIQHNSENRAPKHRSDAYDRMLAEAVSTFA